MLEAICLFDPLHNAKTLALADEERGISQGDQEDQSTNTSTRPRPLSLRDGPKPDDPLNLTHSHGQKSNLVRPNKKNMDVNPFYCYFASVISKGQELVGRASGDHSDI